MFTTKNITGTIEEAHKSGMVMRPQHMAHGEGLEEQGCSSWKSLSEWNCSLVWRLSCGRGGSSLIEKTMKILTWGNHDVLWTCILLPVSQFLHSLHSYSPAISCFLFSCCLLLGHEPTTLSLFDTLFRY